MLTRLVTKNPIRLNATVNYCRSQPMSVLSSFLEYAECGEPGKVVYKRDVQLGTPKSNEVLVKILAAPINPADINVIQGKIHLRVS